MARRGKRMRRRVCPLDGNRDNVRGILSRQIGSIRPKVLPRSEKLSGVRAKPLWGVVTKGITLSCHRFGVGSKEPTCRRPPECPGIPSTDLADWRPGRILIHVPWQWFDALAFARYQI